MNREHIGLFSELIAAGVEFAVVGGVAVNAHGYLRATRDLDLFIRPTISNVQAAYRALEAFGAPMDGLDYTDLLNEEQHFRFGTLDDYVDVLTSIGEMSFDEVWSEYVEVEISGMKVPFISKRSLIKNKMATGRFRDLADVEELQLMPDVPPPFALE
jgi:hypothetical protein